MSAEALITSMEKLLILHKSLFEIAVKKTEIIKEGDIEALGKLLKDEQTHIAAMGKVERERIHYCEGIVPHLDKPTVSDCINLLVSGDKNRLIDVSENLTNIIYQLKEQNYLNQQLIHQSLQLVNFSMNLLMPQSETMNYAPPKNKQNKNGLPLGTFNSKV